MRTFRHPSSNVGREGGHSEAGLESARAGSFTVSAWVTRHHEKITILMLLLVITAYRLVHFGGLAVPACDYEQYRAQAVAIGNGQLALHTPIAPGTPIVMIVLAPLMPGPDPYLHANLVANLVASTALIVLLWSVTRQFLSVPFAALSTWLFAYNPETTAIALQPGSDALFVCCLIGAFVLYNRDSRWAYAAAGTATLFRYHGVLVILALFVGNFIRHRKSLRDFLCSIAATAPTAVWYVMLARASGSAPYAAGASESGGVQTGFFKSMAAATLEILPRSFGEAVKNDNIAATAFGVGCLGVIFLLAVIGLKHFWTTKRERLIPLLFFGIVVAALHTRIQAAPQRYTLPILWIFYMCAVGGLTMIFSEQRNDTKPGVAPHEVLPAALFGGCILFASWLAWPPENVASFWSIAFGLPLIIMAIPLLRKQWRSRSALALTSAITLLIAVLLLGATTFDYTVYVTNRVEKQYAELRPFVDWYREIQKPGDLLMCYAGVSSLLTAPPCDIAPESVILSCELERGDFHERVNDLDVDYVLWTESSFAVEGAVTARFERLARKCNKWFFDDLVRGCTVWQELRRFSNHGRTAIVFTPAENTQKP